jgi:ABC-2 type transport system permease protein
LDQYTVNGGKSLWLIDAVHAEMDSIKPPNFQMMTVANHLNLNDLFFSYGFRVNPVLVKDLYAADIVLQDASEQFNKYTWFYNPLVIPNLKHLQLQSF